MRPCPLKIGASLRAPRVIAGGGSRWERGRFLDGTVARSDLDPLALTDLDRFVAGMDVFSRQSDGTTVAEQYRRAGIRLAPASMDRINGWAEILSRFGDVDGGIRSRIFIHKLCTRLLDCIPAMQHDPNRPEGVLKVDADEEVGGDDAADALRYLVATKSNKIYVRKLVGL